MVVFLDVHVEAGQRGSGCQEIWVLVPSLTLVCWVNSGKSVPLSDSICTMRTIVLPGFVKCFKDTASDTQSSSYTRCSSVCRVARHIPAHLPMPLSITEARCYSSACLSNLFLPLSLWYLCSPPRVITNLRKINLPILFHKLIYFMYRRDHYANLS